MKLSKWSYFKCLIDDGDLWMRRWIVKKSISYADDMKSS